MSTSPHTASRPEGRSMLRPAVLALVGAIAFPAFYLAMDTVGGGPPLPMPDAPAAEVYAYVVNNGSSMALTGLVHLLSVAGLFVFILSAMRLLATQADAPRVVWANRAGMLAALALTVSITLSLFSAVAAPTLGAETVNALRTANFLAGGVIHVMCLGVYVRLTSLAFPGRGLRVFGLIAAVPALLSVLSLAFYYANALILLGRILCMLWILTAGITLFRTTRKAIR